MLSLYRLLCATLSLSVQLFFCGCYIQAIKITALAVMKMRPEEFGKAHMDALNSTLDPVIAAAPEVLRQQEREGVVESRISLLYADLVPATLLPKTQDSSLARQAKNMAHVNLSSTGKVVQREKSGSFDADNESDAEGSDADDSASEGRLSGSGRGSLSKSVGRTRSGTGTGKVTLCDFTTPQQR
jgi:hypothetical protein